MPRTIRFYLDEHVDPAIADGLRRRGIDVTTTLDAGLVSASDEQQLAYARSQSRVIVTFDDDFLAAASHGVTHSGIAYRFQGNENIGRMIRSLELIWELLEIDDMAGRVEYL